MPSGRRWSPRIGRGSQGGLQGRDRARPRSAIGEGEGGRQAGERVEAKPGTEWPNPGLIGRVWHLKGEEKLRHASLQEVKSVSSVWLSLQASP